MPRRIVAFTRDNLNFLTFAVGFGVFSTALAAYSWRLAGVIDGALLMLLAVYPYLATKRTS